MNECTQQHRLRERGRRSMMPTIERGCHRERFLYLSLFTQSSLVVVIKEKEEERLCMYDDDDDKNTYG